jgi:hypothetical protein
MADLVWSHDLVVFFIFYEVAEIHRLSGLDKVNLEEGLKIEVGNFLAIFDT